MFTVYDSKAKAYLPPFYQVMTGQATRIFKNSADDPKHQFGANPEDYTLFHLGEFDDDNAKFEIKKTPESLGTAQEFQTAT